MQDAKILTGRWLGSAFPYVKVNQSFWVWLKSKVSFLKQFCCFPYLNQCSNIFIFALEFGHQRTYCLCATSFELCLNSLSAFMSLLNSWCFHLLWPSINGSTSRWLLCWKGKRHIPRKNYSPKLKNLVCMDSFTKKFGQKLLFQSECVQHIYWKVPRRLFLEILSWKVLNHSPKPHQ